MVALYSVPISAPHGGGKRDAIDLEEPGATDNFITYALTRSMELPRKLL